MQHGRNVIRLPRTAPTSVVTSNPSNKLRLKDPRLARVQQIITTTPKPRETIVDLAEGKIGGDVYMVNASSYDNRDNLSATFFKQLETYDGTDMGRQEIYGEILDPESTGIIKRKHFKMWPADKPTPTLEYVLASYDPATSEKTVNDPTACEVWGIFEELDGGMCAILLDAWDEHSRIQSYDVRLSTTSKR